MSTPKKLNLSTQDERFVLEILKSGSIEQLEELKQLIPGFPHVVIDDPVESRWMGLAITQASMQSIDWLLGQKVDLSFKGLDGYGILHMLLECSRPEKYELLEKMIRHGAPVNQQGINDWTPAHMAAAWDDIEALQILIRYGADLTIRTRIDNYATPYEEAVELGKTKAAEYLRNPTAPSLNRLAKKHSK